jgi:hypothetical protein
MTLIATWFSEGRQAQHPPDPRYPLGYRRECRSPPRPISCPSSRGTIRPSRRRHTSRHNSKSSWSRPSRNLRSASASASTFSLRRGGTDETEAENRSRRGSLSNISEIAVRSRHGPITSIANAGVWLASERVPHRKSSRCLIVLRRWRIVDWRPTSARPPRLPDEPRRHKPLGQGDRDAQSQPSRRPPLSVGRQCGAARAMRAPAHLLDGK